MIFFTACWALLELYLHFENSDENEAKSEQTNTKMFLNLFLILANFRKLFHIYINIWFCQNESYFYHFRGLFVCLFDGY